MLPALLLLSAALHCSGPGEDPGAWAAVARVLEDWHAAAAQADEARYFGHMTDTAVFLGTDGTERWDATAFRAYAHPHFAQGRAWSFRATDRRIIVHPRGEVAWFDEDLDTPNLGPARGSGVLVKEGARWRIAHYHLSVPIPNGLMTAVREQIKASRAVPAPR